MICQGLFGLNPFKLNGHSGALAETFGGIEVRVAQKAIFKIQLHVGSVTTAVEVKSAIPLVEPATASISTVIDSTETTELPLNLRRLGALAVLVPGTVSGLDRGGFGGGFANPFASGTGYKGHTQHSCCQSQSS
jgi:hypothetical protein